MRDYCLMRDVLESAASAKYPMCYGDFEDELHHRNLGPEMLRLKSDGLLDGDMSFEPGGFCTGGHIEGLTDEGREFYRLIENDGVWRTVRCTLGKAGIDVSYPLLKEVCEEIVKRYVTSFIPDIPSK